MTDIMDQTTSEAMLSALNLIQKTLNGQQSLMMQIFRNGERTEKRVDIVERRINSLEQRVNETNERISDLKDELSLMLKMELSGWSANFEDRLDNKLPDLIENAVRTAMKQG